MILICALMEAPEEQVDRAPHGGPPILGALIAVVYGVAGLAFYLYSGRAEGFISPRLGFLLVALSSIPLGFYMLIALTFNFRWPRAASRWLIIAGIGLSYLLIVLGYRLDGARIAETMARGDTLIQDIEDYKRATGAYPAGLGEIAAGGRALPVPALDDSAFAYWRAEDGGYVIAFPSVAFLTCARTSAAPDWACDD